MLWLMMAVFMFRYLDGHARFYRQTIVLGCYANPGNLILTLYLLLHY